MPAAGDGCQSSLSTFVLLCSRESECSYAGSVPLHVQLMLKCDLWSMVSAYVDGATCRNLNLDENLTLEGESFVL